MRLARRDYERARRVPPELAVELARRARQSEVWRHPRAEDDFAAFAPALARNVELAREYGACVAAPGASAYDGLLGDYDFGLRAADLERLFAELAGVLPPLVARAREHTPRRHLAVPEPAQRAAVEGVLRRLGVERASWRVDVSEHAFSAWMGPRDTRITTRYDDGDVESLLSSLHEFGHALYDRQIDPSLRRTNLGAGTSMSIHESQSKLWETTSRATPRSRPCSPPSCSPAASRSRRPTSTPCSWASRRRRSGCRRTRSPTRFTSCSASSSSAR